MSNSFIIIIIVWVIAAIAFSVIVMYYAMAKKNREAAESSIFLTNKKVEFGVWINLYATFENFALTRRFLLALREQFSILAPNDEKFIKEKSAKTAIVLWIISGVTVLMVVLIKPSVYTVALAALTVYFASAEYVSSRLDKYNGMILAQFVKLLSEVRTAFFRHGMIDEAIYESIPEVPHLMQTHAMKMYRVLTDDHMDEAVFQYNDTTPNVFLKRFVAICATTLQHGDAKVDGQSAFVNNIKMLQNDVYAYTRRKRMESKRFQMLTLIAIIPPYVLTAIRNWAISSVEETEPWYAGKWGILMVAAVFVVTLVAYRKIVALKRPKLADTMEHPILLYLCKFAPIKSMLDTYESKNYGKMQALQNLLKRTGSSISSRQFLIQAMSFGAAAGLALTLLLATAESVNKKQAITVFSDMTDKAMGSSEEVNLLITAMTMYYVDLYKDENFVAWYEDRVPGAYEGSDVQTLFSDDGFKTYFSQWLSDDMKNNGCPGAIDYLMDAIYVYNSQHAKNTKLATLYYGTTGEVAAEATDRDKRKAENEIDTLETALNGENPLDTETSYEAVCSGILSHVDDYQGSGYKWYYCLFALLLTYGIYQWQFMSLKGNEKELQIFMKEEVIQLESIVLALRTVAQISQYEILSSMETFAVVFKSSLQKCLNNIDEDEMAAYEQLLEDEPFEPLQRLVKNLMAVDRIGVRQAFNDLDVEISNAIDEFNQDSAIRLDERAALANFLAYIPTYFTIAGYLVVPFMLKSTEKLSSSLTMMS